MGDNRIYIDFANDDDAREFLFAISCGQFNFTYTITDSGYLED